jgi:predicted DNA-binding transcriptional regulator YafY
MSVARPIYSARSIVVGHDGSILMRLCVCNDHPLRTWILGFGGMARVVSPASLAREIFDEIQAARERYMPRLRFEPIKMTLASRTLFPQISAS